MHFDTNNSLNPFNWSLGSKAPTGSGITTRNNEPLGPWQTHFDKYVAREVNPYLYEAIREAMGPVDGAINKMVTLDGILMVEGGNDRLVQMIENWMNNVQVNDLETGMQSFYRSQGNEMYEQGFGVGEPTIEQDAITSLRIADSKGIIFDRNKKGGLDTWYRPPRAQKGRRDGTDNIERVLRNSYQQDPIGASMMRENGYTLITPALMSYAVFNPEADGPYGTSIIRSTEFDAKVILTMKNALARTWERFGDPIFEVQYKTKTKLTSDQLEARRKTIADNLAQAMEIKKSGNSADVVNAIGKDDDLSINVLGHDGQVLEIEMPARFILEQLVSKTGLPSWMLGFHWSTAERLAQSQAEIVLQESRTRFTTRKPGLERIIATMLRLRGETWKDGDWKLAQDLPSLKDILAMAQARFLNTQADMMENGTARPASGDAAAAPKFATVTARGDIKWPLDSVPDSSSIPPSLEVNDEPIKACGCVQHHKVHGSKSERYVENEEELLKLEGKSTASLLAAWRALYGDVIKTLNIDVTGAGDDVVFMLEPNDPRLAELKTLEVKIIEQLGADDADWLDANYEAWGLGVAAASVEFEGIDAVTDAIREEMQGAMNATGLDHVKDTVTRSYSDGILKALEEGLYNGDNPAQVARALKKQFEAKDYEYERLARTEIAEAQLQGKLSQYAAQGSDLYDWDAAVDGCPICKGLERGGPYNVGTGPTIIGDAHPLCRCTIRRHIDG